MAAIYCGDEKKDKMNEVAHAILHKHLMEKGERIPAGKYIPSTSDPMTAMSQLTNKEQKVQL